MSTSGQQVIVRVDFYYQSRFSGFCQYPITFTANTLSPLASVHLVNVGDASYQLPISSCTPQSNLPGTSVSLNANCLLTGLSQAGSFVALVEFTRASLIGVAPLFLGVLESTSSAPLVYPTCSYAAEIDLVNCVPIRSVAVPPQNITVNSDLDFIVTDGTFRSSQPVQQAKILSYVVSYSLRFDLSGQAPFIFSNSSQASLTFRPTIEYNTTRTILVNVPFSLPPTRLLGSPSNPTLSSANGISNPVCNPFFPLSLSPPPIFFHAKNIFSYLYTLIPECRWV